MSNRRFFAFGCSFTKWIWPTWADFIGVNFDEYHNLGKSGACNTYISERIIESDVIYNFNPDTDYVVVSLTGFGRFSYFTDDSWNTHGDILLLIKGHPEKAKWLAKNIYNTKWAVYRSWIAANMIKSYLTNRNIKHKIFMALDTSSYIREVKELNLDQSDVDRVRDIYKLLDFPLSLQEHRGTDMEITNFLNGYQESHPSMKEHYSFVSTYFPEFDTEKTKRLLENQIKSFRWESRELQGQDFYSNWVSRNRALPSIKHFGGLG